MSGYSQWRLLSHADNVGAPSSSVATSVFDSFLLLKVYIRIAGYSNPLATPRMRFNGDAGTNYTGKVSENLAAALGLTSGTGLDLAAVAGGSQSLIEVTIINSVTIEKGMFWDGISGSLIAGTAPNRIIGSGLWVNAAAINQVTIDTGAIGGNFSNGTGISVFGSEAT